MPGSASQSAYGDGSITSANPNSNPNPIYFDRENGVSQGGIGASNVPGIYGDNGVGKGLDGNIGYDATGNDDLNNGGFRTAASSNAAYGGVNSNRAANRGVNGNRAGVANDARLRGTASSASGYGQQAGSISTGTSTAGAAAAGITGSAGGSGGSEAASATGFNNQESFRSSSSSASVSQSSSSSTLGVGSQQGSGFLSRIQNNSKV